MRDENGDRESDARQNTRAEKLTPPNVRRLLSHSEPRGQVGKDPHADRLSQYQGKDYSQADRINESIPPSQRHSRVCQRKDWQNQVGDPWLQSVFESLGRRLHAIQDRLQGSNQRLLAPFSIVVFVTIEHGIGLGHEALNVGRAAGRDNGRQQYAGDGGMNSRIQEGQPQSDAEQRIGQR